MKTKLIGLISIAAIVTSPTLIASARHSGGNTEHFHPTCIAFLKDKNPSARITLRSGPGVQYRSLGYGLVKDRVELLASYPPEPDFETDSRGATWYRVFFPRSRAKGWIREDLLRLQCRSVHDL